MRYSIFRGKNLYTQEVNAYFGDLLGRLESLLIAWVFIGTSVLGIFVLGVGPTEGSTATRAAIDEPFDVTFYTTGGDTFRPGDGDRFYVNLRNYYDGSEFAGSSDPGNTSTVKEVQIHFLGLFDENEDEITTSPLIWEEDLGSFYNNDGDGYEIAQSNNENFYADVSSNQLSFAVKTNNVFIGELKMRARIDFRYMVDWDGGTQYDWSWSSQVTDRSFRIRSYIGGDGSPYFKIYAFEENFNTDNIHSGATHKRFGIRSLYSHSGTLTDIEAVVSFPGSPIVVEDPLFTSSSLANNIFWRVTIPKDFPPGAHEVSIQMSYLRNGEEIVEAPVLYEFMVEYTPLIMPPEFNDLTSPLFTFQQNNMPDTMEFPVTNEGNVDLTDVVVALDTDNAKYYGSGSIWYDENSNANDRYEPQEFEIPTLAVGGSSTVTFSLVNFLPRLPPGLYKLPIDYKVKYQDTGITGNVVEEKEAGGWDEIGRYEHRNIMQQIDYPEDSSGTYNQYLLIEVLPDPAGPNINGYIDSGQNQYPGTGSAYMRLRVYNYEMYRFLNLEYHIHTDGGSPFSLPYASGDENMTTLPPIYRSGLSASTSSSTQSDTFYFYAKIRDDAMPGINFFQVDMVGYDENYNPVSLTFTSHIQLRARQPSFRLLNIEVGDILDDRSVEVTVEMQNMGLGGAKNLSCFFTSSSTGFVSTDSPLDIGAVGPDDIFHYTFHFRPDGENRYFINSYSGNIYFAYFDDIGTYDEMFSGSSLYIRFDIYHKLPDMRIIKVEAPIVDRNQEFDVELTVMNYGGSTASDIMAMVPYNSALFEIISEEQDLGDLEPGDTITFTITMRAGKEIGDGTTYSFTVFFSYSDIQGRSRTYSEAETESFSVRIKDRIIPSEQVQVVKDDGQIISEGAGSVMLGIFILIAVFMFARMTNNRNEAKVTSEKKETPAKDPVKEKKIEIEEDDEDEDEDEIEGDEDEADPW